jgi:hypothetical protein
LPPSLQFIEKDFYINVDLWSRELKIP